MNWLEVETITKNYPILINLDNVTDICIYQKDDLIGSVISFNCACADEQNYIVSKNSYEELKQKILNLKK